MGTFHDHLGELHGITIVVYTTGATVYVGRCHEANDQHVVLLDADRHVEGTDAGTRADYLTRAAQMGVWKKYDRLTLPRGEVKSIVRLGAVS
ncbi:MAG: hypothetical protein ACKVX7_12670 [Planctomycetota bacterium]